MLILPERSKYLFKIWRDTAKSRTIEEGKQKRLMKKNFGLTKTQFDELVNQLQSGINTIFERVFLSHFQDCRIYLVRQLNAPTEVAYDVTMDALLEFMKRLKEGKITYGNLRFLFTKMASQIYLKRIKKESHITQIDEIDLPIEMIEVEPSDLAILEQCWDQLQERCQKILKAFYYDNIQLKELADKLEKSPTALRKQKQRCMEHLKELFYHQFNLSENE